MASGWEQFKSVARDERWTFPLAAFAGSRLVLLLLSALGLRVYPHLMGAIRDPYFQNVLSLDGLFRWDSGYYLSSATTGYPVNDLHFANVWPGFGLCARALALIGIDPHVGLLLVANLAGLASVFVLYRLFLDLTDQATARFSLLLFLAYPFAFFQAAAYPESLMVLGSSLGILLARRGHHVWAGLVVGLTSACRHLTLLAGAGLVAAQLRQRPTVRGFFFNWRLLTLLLPWLGPAAFLFFLSQRYGDALVFYRARDLWGAAAWLSVADIFRNGFDDARHLSYVVFAIIPVVGTVMALPKKAWFEVTAFGAVLAVVLMSVGAEALGRYSASLWPGFLYWGHKLSTRPALQTSAVAALAMCQGLFFFLFSHQFPIL